MREQDAEIGTSEAAGGAMEEGREVINLA